jgi:hypothetical protein
MSFEMFEPTRNQQATIEWSDLIGNCCTVFRLEGSVDTARLRSAVHAVVQRCPSFS